MSVKNHGWLHHSRRTQQPRMGHNVGETSFSKRSSRMPVLKRSMAIHGDLAHWRQNCPPVPTSLIQERRAHHCEYWRKWSVSKFLSFFTDRSIKSWHETPSTKTKIQHHDDARRHLQTSEGSTKIALSATSCSLTLCSTIRRIFRSDKEKAD